MRVMTRISSRVQSSKQSMMPNKIREESENLVRSLYPTSSVCQLIFLGLLSRPFKARQAPDYPPPERRIEEESESGKLSPSRRGRAAHMLSRGCLLGERLLSDKLIFARDPTAIKAKAVALQTVKSNRSANWRSRRDSNPRPPT